MPPSPGSDQPADADDGPDRPDSHGPVDGTDSGDGREGDGAHAGERDWHGTGGEDDADREDDSGEGADEVAADEYAAQLAAEYEADQAAEVVSLPPEPVDAAEYRAVLDAIAGRWPETQIAPDIRRIASLLALISDPHTSAPVIHIAGTNGKTSTARMIDSLLRSFGLQPGLYTSPELAEPTERIVIGGRPISRAAFVKAYREMEPLLEWVDSTSLADGEPALTAFEVLTALAFAAFADAPVDVMIVECGMGGAWDATNVVTPAVSVITPIGLDHQNYLGESLEQIAGEKAGIIKPGAPVVIGAQPREALHVLDARAADEGSPAFHAGVDFDCASTQVAVGGQVVDLRGLAGEYPDVFLPLHGPHQGANAAMALAAVELFLGADREATPPRTLDATAVRDGFAAANSPGRLEALPHPGTDGVLLLIDAAHNPAGARVLADALLDSFGLTVAVAVVAVLADKDAAGILAPIAEVTDAVVVSQNRSPRAMPAEQLAELARPLWGDHRVLVVEDLRQAVDEAMQMAALAARVQEDDGASGGTGVPGVPGVIVTGSVVTAGQVRMMYPPMDEWVAEAEDALAASEDDEAAPGADDELDAPISPDDPDYDDYWDALESEFEDDQGAAEHGSDDSSDGGSDDSSDDGFDGGSAGPGDRR